MMSAKPFFNCPYRVSIGMFLQNISPIELFINVLGLPECKSGGRKKKKSNKKKSRQGHRGSRQRTGCPNNRKSYMRSSVFQASSLKLCQVSAFSLYVAHENLRHIKSNFGDFPYVWKVICTSEKKLWKKFSLTFVNLILLYSVYAF